MTEWTGFKMIVGGVLCFILFLVLWPNPWSWLPLIGYFVGVPGPTFYRIWENRREDAAIRSRLPRM